MRSLSSVLLLLSVVATAHADNWGQFRGPNFNGSANETNLPTDWSTTKNIVWSADLPGPSAATPSVWNDRVFVSSTDSESDSLKAMCFDRKNGQLLWEHVISTGTSQDTRSNFSAPSPATDGELVVFFYGNGDLVAFDFNGKQLWSRNIQKDYGTFAFQWTFSTSPLLFDNKLYLQVLQRDVPANGRGLKDRKNESYLLAMNPKTGKTLWRHVRPSEANAESLEAFSTPMPYEYNGRTEILIVGGDDLTGHDPETGKELWRWGTWNPDRIPHWRLVPSAVAGDGVVLACAPKKDPIYAVQAGGKGQLDDSALLWTSKEERSVTSDVPTPAFYDGDFFVLSDLTKTLSRVEPKSGKVKWSIKTPGGSKYEASPLAADGKIYLVNFDGEVVIVDAKQGETINVISMVGERSKDVVRSSIIAADGQLFVRTNRKLYCVGQ